MKFRKKPVIIEAYQTNKEMLIHTLEGDMKASVGDYIITGVNGEQYPCKPDIFKKTYDRVTNTNFDRIKAMSVEELAELLNNITKQCCECGYYEGCVEKCTFNMFGTCEQSNIQKWLESEVTE